GAAGARGAARDRPRATEASSAATIATTTSAISRGRRRSADEPDDLDEPDGGAAPGLAGVVMPAAGAGPRLMSPPRCSRHARPRPPRPTGQGWTRRCTPPGAADHRP